MAKVGKMKKGVLFTVSVMLLSISILTLVIFLSEQSSKGKQSAVQLSDIDEVSSKYSGIEDQLERIISTSINISVDNSTVFIEERLPVSQQIAIDIERFAWFEYNYSEENVSMNLSNLKNASFLIQPNRIEIMHESANFYIVPEGGNSSAGSVQTYEVNLTFASERIDAAAWQTLSNASNGSGAVVVHVRIQDESYAVNLDFYETLDKYSTSLLNITKEGSLVGYVRFYSPAALQVQHPENIGLKASVGLSNPVYVEANDTLTISSFANKTGRIRIA